MPAETARRSRVVIRLVRMVPFEINTVGNRSLDSHCQYGSPNQHHTKQSISFIQPTLTQSTTQCLPTNQLINPPPIQISQDNFVQDIDFRRTQDGAGHIAITLSNPSIIVDMRRESNDVILEIPATRLPNRLNRRLDVLDFATPISFIDTFPVGNDIRMNITIADNGEYHAYQTENVYVVEVKEK
jgi:type IV pilus assembly protein PilQ